MVKPAKATTVKIEPEAPKKEYKGNEFVTAEQQRGYLETLEEMKADPIIGKLMIAPDWPKITTVLTYLMYKNGTKLGGED